MCVLQEDDGGGAGVADLQADESADAHHKQLAVSNTAAQEALLCLWLSLLAVSVLVFS